MNVNPIYDNYPGADYSDSDYDTDDDLFIEEHDHDIDQYEEKSDNQYCIGQAVFLSDQNPELLLLGESVSATLFYKYPIRTIENCIIHPNSIFNSLQVIQIKHVTFKIQKANYVFYMALLKTYWIRLVQRHWRKTLKQRRIRLTSLNYLRQRELSLTRIPLPQLKGMLSVYKK